MSGRSQQSGVLRRGVLLLLAAALGLPLILWPRTGECPAVSTRSQVARAHFVRALRDHFSACYQAVLADADDDKPLLGQFALGWPRWRENGLGLPAEVFAAYIYYVETVSDADWGGVGVYRVPVGGDVTYAVRVWTDGDDGWLEVYDQSGELLGAGRTYIELVGWGDRDQVRALVHTGGLPPGMQDAHKRTLWGKPQVR
jgi:hypothetical protein